MNKEEFFKKFKEMDKMIKNVVEENKELKEELKTMRQRVVNIEDILHLNEIHQSGGDIETESGGDWTLEYEPEEGVDEDYYIEAMQEKHQETQEQVKPKAFEDEFELPDLRGINNIEKQIKQDKMYTPAVKSIMSQLKEQISKNKPR